MVGFGKSRREASVKKPPELISGTHIPKPSWFHRRILIYTTLLLDACILIGIVGGWLLGATDNTAIEIIAGATIIRDMVILACYVFGASIEDINLMKMIPNLQGIGGGGFFDRGESGESTRRI